MRLWLGSTQRVRYSTSRLPRYVPEVPDFPSLISNRMKIRHLELSFRLLPFFAFRGHSSDLSVAAGWIYALLREFALSRDPPPLDIYENKKRSPRPRYERCVSRMCDLGVDIPSRDSPSWFYDSGLSVQRDSHFRINNISCLKSK